jgi:hypothetical protein
MMLDGDADHAPVQLQDEEPLDAYSRAFFT